MESHLLFALLYLVQLPRPGFSASSVLDVPPPPPPVIDMFDNCPITGCKRMIVTRKDYRECEPVRLRLVPRPDCVEEGQQVSYPPCLEDQGCLALYCPETTSWPLVCPVADSILTQKASGTNQVSFGLFDDAKAVLGQCPRRRHFGFYTVWTEEDIKNGAGGFMWDIQSADAFTEKCQGHNLPSCTLFSENFGADLYIYGNYPQTYELIHPKIKGVEGELLRYRWVHLSAFSFSLPKNFVTPEYENNAALGTFNQTSELTVDEGYRGSMNFSLAHPSVTQVVLPQWQPASTTALIFKCNTTGLFARNSTYANTLVGPYSGCCIMETRLHLVAMQRQRLCATFATSSDASLVGLQVENAPQGGVTTIALVDGTLSYSMTVPAITTGLIFTARQRSPFASLTLYYLAFGSSLKTGVPSQVVSLGDPGSTRTWTVRVRAEDGTLVIYSVTVHRES